MEDFSVNKSINVETLGYPILFYTYMFGCGTTSICNKVNTQASAQNFSVLTQKCAVQM